MPHDNPHWMAAASCRHTPIQVFFPEVGQPTEPAKKICATCPVVQTCYNHAMANPWLAGIWGGTSEKQRRQIRTGRRQPPTWPPTPESLPHD